MRFPRLDARYLVVHSITNSVKFIFTSVLVASASHPIRGTQNRPGGCCTRTGFESHLGSTEQTHPNFVLREDTIFTTLDSPQPGRLTAGAAISVSQYSRPHKGPWRYNPKRRLPALLFPRLANPRETMKHCLPTMTGRQGQSQHYLNLKILTMNSPSRFIFKKKKKVGNFKA